MPRLFMIAGVLGLLWPGAACGPTKADLTQLRAEVSRLRTRLASVRDAQRKDTAKLRQRVAQLEASLAVVRRARVARGPTPPRFRPAARPAPRATCPAELPDGARRIRRRMRVAKVQKLLRGVRTRKAKAIKLTGSGTRTDVVWSGPCFQITLAGGRVTGVELEGVAPRRRRSRRRR